MNCDAEANEELCFGNLTECEQALVLFRLDYDPMVNMFDLVNNNPEGFIDFCTSNYSGLSGGARINWDGIEDFSERVCRATLGGRYGIEIAYSDMYGMGVAAVPIVWGSLQEFLDFIESARARFAEDITKAGCVF